SCCGASVFFFQAEDGIRDFHVTGVQTCALPISLTAAPCMVVRAGWFFRTSWLDNVAGERGEGPGLWSAFSTCRGGEESALSDSRSEERRVGKECRSRCGAG